LKQLLEITDVRQPEGEDRRRWFTSTSMDLFVWLGKDGEPSGFQFTYDKGLRERALTWKAQKGYVHDEVDDGEGFSASRYKETPLLKVDGQPDIERIAGLLTQCGATLPAEIAAFVIETIRAHPARKSS
jgi:hypothetical protein